jgi:hypothetical protein
MNYLDAARAQFPFAKFEADSDPNGLYAAIRSCLPPVNYIPQQQARLFSSPRDAKAWVTAEHKCYLDTDGVYRQTEPHFVAMVDGAGKRLEELASRAHAILKESAEEWWAEEFKKNGDITQECLSSACSA